MHLRHYRRSSTYTISYQLNNFQKIRNVLLGGRVVDIEAAVFDNEAALPNGCSGLMGLRFLSQLGD